MPPAPAVWGIALFSARAAGAGFTGSGGLRAQDDGSNETYEDAYFDTDTTGLSGRNGHSSWALQSPTTATGFYANRDDLDVNGNGTANEDPWDFGSGSQYPVISYGSITRGRVRAGATGNPYLGGLVGALDGSSARLAASYSTADVSGRGFSGGLAASIGQGKVVACYARGAVAGNRAGGLFAINTAATVTASYYGVMFAALNPQIRSPSDVEIASTRH